MKVSFCVPSIFAVLARGKPGPFSLGVEVWTGLMHPHSAAKLICDFLTMACRVPVSPKLGTTKPASWPLGSYAGPSPSSPLGEERAQRGAPTRRDRFMCPGTAVWLGRFYVFADHGYSMDGSCVRLTSFEIASYRLAPAPRASRGDRHCWSLPAPTRVGLRP